MMDGTSSWLLIRIVGGEFSTGLFLESATSSKSPDSGLKCRALSLRMLMLRKSFPACRDSRSVLTREPPSCLNLVIGASSSGESSMVFYPEASASESESEVVKGEPVGPPQSPITAR